jgi:hypothetical protein
MQALPVAVLEHCSDDDRTVVENICLVAQEYMPALNLAQAAITLERGKYQVCIPLAAGHATLNDMRGIQTYNPARVHDIRVLLKDTHIVLRIDICSESTPLSCTELEVVRVTKRSRWF